MPDVIDFIYVFIPSCVEINFWYVVLERFVSLPYLTMKLYL